MKRVSGSIWIGIIGALATIIAAVIGTFAVYDLSSRGNSPPKRLQAEIQSPVDPLEDLTNEEIQLSIDVRMSEREIRNLRVIQTTLINNGSAPILPSDITEPLAVRSLHGWEIINIVYAGQPGTEVAFDWERAGPTEARAKPTLLNPGDRVRATVYLSHPQDPPPQISPQTPIIAWEGRIVNLSRIELAPDPFEDMASRVGPIYVIIWLWPLITLVLSFVVYLWITLRLLDRSGFIRRGRNSTYATICSIAIINLCASEAGASYIFGTSPIFYVAAQHHINAPPIIINIALIIGLFLYSRLKKSGSKAALESGHVNIEN